MDKSVPRPLRVVGRVLDGLYYLTIALAIFGLVVILAVVSWQVISRYVTEKSAPWAPDLSELVFIWTAMFAIAVGVRQGRHMSINVFAAIKSRLFNIVLETVVMLVIVWTSYVLTVNAMDSLSISFNRVLPALGIAAGWLQLALPVGFSLCAIFAVEVWLRSVLSLPPAVARLENKQDSPIEASGELSQAGDVR